MLFVTVTNQYDYATIAYSSSGMPLWTNRYGALQYHDDYAQAVAVGLTEIGFTDHSPMRRDDFDNWRMRAEQLDEYVEKVRRALQLRREGKNDFVIAKELKIWPMDQQKPFFQTASNIGEAGAGRLIELLTDIDYRSKNGLGDMRDNVERFLLSVKE